MYSSNRLSVGVNRITLKKKSKTIHAKACEGDPYIFIELPAGKFISSRGLGLWLFLYTQVSFYPEIASEESKKKSSRLERLTWCSMRNKNSSNSG